MSRIHHALVSFGSPGGTREFAIYIAKLLRVSATHNENFHIRTYATLDVEEARALSGLMSLRGTGARVLVVGAQAVGREAQNALLKILEEPGEGATFAFLVPRGVLIPTVLSRLSEVEFQAKKNDTSEAKAFLDASGPMRSKQIEKIVKDKDKQLAYELVCDIEMLLQKNTANKNARLALTEIATMRSYLMDQSASVKMILEHLALVLPTH